MAVSIVVALFILGGVGAAALAMSGHNPVSKALQRLTGNNTSPSSPPAPCPLTGAPPAGGTVPRRTALAVKVENTTTAYPLAGLDKADIVYEELVEGGITRFMAVYQCQDSPRVGPVRSARTTDPGILRQFAKHSPIAYSGGQKAVVNLLNAMGLVGLTDTSSPPAFHRDPARAAPHNLFVNTQAAYSAGRQRATKGIPSAVFTYSVSPIGGKHIHSVSIQFSYSAVADWSWVGNRWVRMLGGTPMKLENGTVISAANVLIQQVSVTQGPLVDVLGTHSPEVKLTGTGRAWLLRDGRVIPGVWKRAGLNSRTVFLTKGHTGMTLAPGVTWVELAPKGEPVTFKK
jgi:hypothetical protein